MITTLLLILAAFFLILLNAFFVAAEFGMVKLRQTRIEVIVEQYPWRGRLLAKVHAKLDTYLSACQLGITLASLGLGWIGEPALSKLIEPLFRWTGLVNSGAVEVVSFLIAFSLLSFLHIVLGELMPKSLAIRQSESISLWTAAPLYGFYWAMYPIIWVLNFCSNLCLHWLRLDITHPGEQSHTPEEIKLILRSSQLHGELSSQESTILAHTLDLTDLRAIEVMCLIQDMVTLDNHSTKETLVNILSQHRYSRYPVFDKTHAQIIGLVHVKDLYWLMDNKKDCDPLDLQPLIRTIPKVPYRLPALTLLRQFQEGMPHFALVYGKQANLIGFVTLDNVLHLVIGVIKDEFHKTQDAWVTHSDGSLTVKGSCPLFALERALNITLDLTPEQEEINTIAGLMLHKAGLVPDVGEVIQFTTFSAIVEKKHHAQITQVRIKPKKIKKLK